MKRNGFLWNTIGSLTYAMANIFFSFILTRYLGIEESGKFGLAFAEAQSLYIIGVFGIDAIQMTNIEKKFLFRDFFISRVITCFFMLFGCSGYIIICSYKREQSIFLLLLTIYFGVYALADVFQIQLFLENRLDLMGKSLFYRSIASYIIFAVIILTTRSIIFALISAIIINVLVFPFVTLIPLKKYDIKCLTLQFNGIKYLLREGITLCISNFLFMLLSNSPRYAVNSALGEYWQGIFNILVIPIMMINLLSRLVFMPVLESCKNYIKEENVSAIIGILFKIIGFVLALGIVCVLFISTIGLQFMSYIFSVDLMIFKNEMVLMVLAAIPMALVSILFLVLVAINKSRVILFSVFCSVVGSFLTNQYIVNRMKLKGAFVVLIIWYSLDVLFFIWAIAKEVFRWRKKDVNY